MPATWPSQLQQKLNEDGFSYNIGPTVVRTEMDIGPAKVRRRFTKSVDTLTAIINLTVSEYSVFTYFYDTTLNGGSTTFNFLHPITGATIEARFVSDPSIRSIGGDKFQASMEWEILP